MHGYRPVPNHGFGNTPPKIRARTKSGRNFHEIQVQLRSQNCRGCCTSRGSRGRSGRGRTGRVGLTPHIIRTLLLGEQPQAAVAHSGPRSCRARRSCGCVAEGRVPLHRLLRLLGDGGAIRARIYGPHRRSPLSRASCKEARASMTYACTPNRPICGLR
eukprot:SAG11_NODE_4446_length_1891_cov_15.168527_1_plen_159_part_00